MSVTVSRAEFEAASGTVLEVVEGTVMRTLRLWKEMKKRVKKEVRLGTNCAADLGPLIPGDRYSTNCICIHIFNSPIPLDIYSLLNRYSMSYAIYNYLVKQSVDICETGELEFRTDYNPMLWG